ncbi:hypothetical protein D3C77_434300 [compost metagenome]
MPALRMAFSQNIWHSTFSTSPAVTGVRTLLLRNTRGCPPQPDTSRSFDMHSMRSAGALAGTPDALRLKYSILKSAVLLFTKSPASLKSGFRSMFSWVLLPIEVWIFVIDWP